MIIDVRRGKTGATTGWFNDYDLRFGRLNVPMDGLFM